MTTSSSLSLTLALIGIAMTPLLAARCGGKAIVDTTPGTGGAGGSSSASKATSTTVSSTGTGQSCAQIASAYRAAVKSALVCNPAVSAEQCQKRISPPDLEKCCGSVWVNKFDTKNIAMIEDRKKAWNAAGCNEGCNATDCAMEIPTVGICDSPTKACRSIELMPPG
jgi:hypothetical protein